MSEGISVEAEWLELPELRSLANHLVLTRLERGLSQGNLAGQCGLSQAQISLFEAGRRLPSLDQFIRLARALDVPLQHLLSGADRPGESLKDLAVELRRLGAVDLWVAGAAVPGAARRPEEVIALILAGGSPDPRVVETVPALLSWNEINPAILRAHGIATKTLHRLAWLADVALAIDRQKGFPGGCRRDTLLRFLKPISLPLKTAPWDDLGRSLGEKPTSPIWKRWKIRYEASITDFEKRARDLVSVRQDNDGAIRRSNKFIYFSEQLKSIRLSLSKYNTPTSPIINSEQQPQAKSTDSPREKQKTTTFRRKKTRKTAKSSDKAGKPKGDSDER
jgi:transcriptional regulator with XRE-family HTH domain